MTAEGSKAPRKGKSAAFLTFTLGAVVLVGGVALMVVAYLAITGQWSP